MEATATRFTRADYERLPEDMRCELLDGRLVKQPSPEYRHGRVELELLFRLVTLVGRCRVATAPADVEIDEYTVLRPDLSVFAEPLPPRAKTPLPIPQVVVEVLSAATASRDRSRKTRAYLRAGVREVWLVDPDTGTIEVRTPGSAASYGPDDEAASAALPHFRVTGAALIR